MGKCQVAAVNSIQRIAASHQNPVPVQGLCVRCRTVQECEECANVKLTQKTVELDFEIEKGMDTGYVITLAEAGEPHADGDSGDLNIHIVALPDRLFKREGVHLKINWEISLSDALTGFSHEIAHLDGHKVCFLVHMSLV
jgi:DnaJ-class molecular chaperone